MAKSTLSVSFEQVSKHSTMTRLKLGISAVGQRYSSKKKTKKYYTIQKGTYRIICVTKTL